MSVMWKRRVQNGSWTINHNSVLLPVSPFSFFDLFFFFSFWSFSPKQESSPFLRALSLHTYSSKETWNLIQGEDVFDKRVDSSNFYIYVWFFRSVLYLLYLLLSKEIKRLKVILCCYYGCRDMEGVMRCIKKNGTSLEHLELSRGALLR